MDNNLILNIILAVVNLVRQAIDGDSDAQQRLKNILPTELQVQLVQEVQRQLDQEKFGPRK